MADLTPAAPRPIPRSLMALAAAALLAGLWGGLVRAGWGLPAAGPLGPEAHALLLVTGFFGAVVSLERAVAARRPWARAAAPLAVAAGAGPALGLPWEAAGALAAAAAALFALVTALIMREAPTLYMAVMAGGALSWLAAGLGQAWGTPVSNLVLPLAGFLVLTIVGERLELSRLAPPSALRMPAFLGAASVFVVGVGAAPLGGAAFRIAGAGLVALGAWMVVYDVARRTIRLAAPTRYIAACLLTGAIWLIVGGVLWLSFGSRSAGFAHDASLHAVLVGFVFSMVFGHALLVVPALLGVGVPYRGRFYFHLGLLHVSLVVRIAGDLLESAYWRRWGGMGNVAAVVVFIASTAIAVAGRGPSAET